MRGRHVLVTLIASSALLGRAAEALALIPRVGCHFAPGRWCW
jgi:hypothetical protein